MRPNQNMEDDFCVNTISVELAFQRELAYRKKLELELGSDNEMLKNLVPLQEKSLIPYPISDIPDSSTPTSFSTNPFSHFGLHCKEKNPAPRPIMEFPNSSAPSNSLLTKRKEPPITSPLSHSDLHCKVCNIVCSCRSNLEQHLKGHKHRSKLEKLEKWQRRWCNLCEVPCTNEETLKIHFEGKKHKLKLLESGGSSGLTTKLAVKAGVALMSENRRFYCSLCRIWCIDESCFEQHLNGKTHKLAACSSHCIG